MKDSQAEILAEALRDCFLSSALTTSGGDPGTLVDAVHRLATQVKYLGGGDNTDPRGAIEFLGVQVENAGRAIADAIDGLADAVRELRAGPDGDFGDGPDPCAPPH